MFNSITYTPLQELVFIFLFAPNLTSNMLVVRQTNPEAPPSYNRVWSFKTTWDSRQDVLDHKYLELLDLEPEVEAEPMETGSPKHQPAKVNINIEEEFRSMARFIGIAADPSDIELMEFTKLAPLNLVEDFKRIFVKNF